MNFLRQHPDTKEYIRAAFFGELVEGDEFFIADNFRFYVVPGGAKCSSVGDTPPQQPRQFDDLELVTKIVKLEEVLFQDLEIGDEFWNAGGPEFGVLFQKSSKNQCVHLSGQMEGHVEKSVDGSWLVKKIVTKRKA